MTFDEALVRQREHLKISIRNRLHRYNPDKYPRVKEPSATEVVDVAITLMIPKVKLLFENDDVFFNAIRRKE